MAEEPTLSTSKLIELVKENCCSDKWIWTHLLHVLYDPHNNPILITELGVQDTDNLRQVFAAIMGFDNLWLAGGVNLTRPLIQSAFSTLWNVLYAWSEDDEFTRVDHPVRLLGLIGRPKDYTDAVRDLLKGIKKSLEELLDNKSDAPSVPLAAPSGGSSLDSSSSSSSSSSSAPVSVAPGEDIRAKKLEKEMEEKQGKQQPPQDDKRNSELFSNFSSLVEHDSNLGDVEVPQQLLIMLLTRQLPQAFEWMRKRNLISAEEEANTVAFVKEVAKSCKDPEYGYGVLTAESSPFSAPAVIRTLRELSICCDYDPRTTDLDAFNHRIPFSYLYIPGTEQWDDSERRKLFRKECKVKKKIATQFYWFCMSQIINKLYNLSVLLEDDDEEEEEKEEPEEADEESSGEEEEGGEKKEETKEETNLFSTFSDLVKNDIWLGDVKIPHQVLLYFLTNQLPELLRTLPLTTRKLKDAEAFCDHVARSCKDAKFESALSSTASTSTPYNINNVSDALWVALQKMFAYAREGFQLTKPFDFIFMTGSDQWFESDRMEIFQKEKRWTHDRDAFYGYCMTRVLSNLRKIAIAVEEEEEELGEESQLKKSKTSKPLPPLPPTPARIKNKKKNKDKPQEPPQIVRVSGKKNKRDQRKFYYC